MAERTKDINDFFFQYLVTLATSAEFLLNAPPGRYGITTLMRVFKMALGMPLKSKEIEDKDVYKKLRKLMEEMQSVPTAQVEEWNECVKKTVAILAEQM
ncbi:MAG TPA: hypothetical protein VMT42_01945 [candidate division Zixibacteria bacterium]|nr:hypothetical protein [candidate division Zixibacteria bacterium]